MENKQKVELPEDIWVTIRVRMYALGALVWDYVDTVLIIARQMRLSETKKLSRAVKELRKDYDYFRSCNVETVFRERELQWAMDFEDYVKPHITALTEGIKREMTELGYNLDTDTFLFVMAVQHAQCALDALQVYANGCNKALSRYGVDMVGKTILPLHFTKLAVLLPEFGGNMFDRHSPIRRKAAGEIAKELAKIVVCDKNGDLDQPEI